jgi:hypothetical protein
VSDKIIVGIEAGGTTGAEAGLKNFSLEKYFKGFPVGSHFNNKRCLQGNSL